MCSQLYCVQIVPGKKKPREILFIEIIQTRSLSEVLLIIN